MREIIVFLLSSARRALKALARQVSAELTKPVRARALRAGPGLRTDADGSICFSRARAHARVGIRMKCPDPSAFPARLVVRGNGVVPVAATGGARASDSSGMAEGPDDETAAVYRGTDHRDFEGARARAKSADLCRRHEISEVTF